MKVIKKYLKVWFLMSRNSFMTYMYQKIAFFIFLTGKLVRFSLFFLFLANLLKGSFGVLGYTPKEYMFVFLTYVMVDTVTQFLFREVYRFRPLVHSGDFDLILVKPINPLFRSLMGGADVIDLVTVPIFLGILTYYSWGFSAGVGEIGVFILLLISGLFIATSFHIAILAMGIITFEVDHLVMAYRDVVSMGRFPVDIYKEPVRTVLTYIVPVGLMVTLPVKAFLGKTQGVYLVVPLMFSILIFYLSLKFWNYALKKYTSASS